MKMSNTELTVVQVAAKAKNDALAIAEAKVMAAVSNSDYIVPADVPLLVGILTTYKASFNTMLKLIETHDLSARSVALIYETRDSCGEDVSLAALARLGDTFPELMTLDSDELATEINEALRGVSSRWPRREFYPSTVFKLIHELVARTEDPLTFSQAVELLTNESESPDDE
jgi:hypothetical protein